MKNNKNLLKRISGFTLIEMMVVLAIITALSFLIVPVITGFMEKAYNSADAENARVICLAIRGECMRSEDFYEFTTNPWPEGNDYEADDHGYVYVDKDEVRVSSYKVAKVLEKEGFITSADAGTVRGKRGDVKEYVYTGSVCQRMLCKSNKTWYRYQINIYDRGGTVDFSYCAVAYATEGKNTSGMSSSANTQDPIATEAFASRTGGEADYKTSFGAA